MRIRNGRGGENLVGNGDNGLPYLVTHAILGGDAIYARLPVECCWTEMFLSQMMRHWGMTFVARHLDSALFSDKILFVKYWFFVRIRRNMNRAAPLMLRRGPCDCFMNCMLPLMWRLHWLLMLRRLSRLDKIPLSDCQIAARYFTEAKYLRESGSKNQRNVGDLAAREMNS